ncbi:MAG: class I SAM-dependent methyltransferase [Candidatus Helarchaeota archaeon]
MSSKTRRNKEFFERVADQWDEKNPHNPEVLKRIVEFLELRQGFNILDVGAGTGVMVPYLEQKASPNGRITAVDYSERMIAIARSKFPPEMYPRVKFLAQDINDTPMNEEYDVILCHNCFPHFIDQQATVLHLTRGLKRGGKLMIAHSKARDWINRLHENTSGVEDDYLPTIKELSAILREANLTILKQIDNEKMFVVLSKKS